MGQFIVMEYQKARPFDIFNAFDVHLAFRSWDGWRRRRLQWFVFQVPSRHGRVGQGQPVQWIQYKNFICQFLVMVNTQNRTLDLLISNILEILDSKSYEVDGETTMILKNRV